MLLTPAIIMDNYANSEFPKARMDVLKKSMTLNFAPGTNGGLLDSPDLKMVQLTSPDLESLIFQQSGVLLQTPTPGALMRMISFREEEKPDLRGFDEALAKMHTQRAENLQQLSEGEYSIGQPISSEAQQQVELVYSRAPSKRPFNETIIDQASSAPPAKRRLASGFAHSVASNEDDSQCSSGSVSNWSEEESYSRNVPRGGVRDTKAGHGQRSSYASRGGKLGASGVEPVDMHTQDRLRVERKRERNRLAARKCRERKIRKIDDLSGQVQKLENDKKTMALRLSRLQTEITRLRNAIQDHAHAGCKVPLAAR